MVIDERQTQILDLLKDRNFISYKEISENLFSSVSTIRRDVIKMEKKGLLTTVKGGVSKIINQNNESSRTYRELLNLPEKKKIANLASQFLFDGSTYFFDSSTTVAQLIYFLKNYHTSTIFTNSLENALLVVQNTQLEVYLLGGVISKSTNSTTGYYTINMANDFSIDYFIFSCKGLSDDGYLTEANVDTQKCKQAMLKNSKKHILLLDNTKLHKSYLLKTCSLNRIDAVVLDSKPDEYYLKLFEDLKVKVIY